MTCGNTPPIKSIRTTPWAAALGIPRSAAGSRGLAIAHRVIPGCWNLPSPPNRHCTDRKSTRLNSSHVSISYAVFCLKKKKQGHELHESVPQRKGARVPVRACEVETWNRVDRT